jgi:hypothetical protein
MDENALYYTFSSVAQTLAAGFGILAAFVLYRLKDMEAGLAQANEVFKREQRLNQSEVWRLLAESGGSGVMDAAYKSLQGTDRMPSREFNDAVSAAVLWRKVWLRAQSLLRRSLVLTVADITLCLLALPIVPAIVKSGTGLVLAALARFLGVAALVAYTMLILSVLETTGPDDWMIYRRRPTTNLADQWRRLKRKIRK